MTIIIHWRKLRDVKSRSTGRLLHWTATGFLLVGCLLLGLCAVVYFQAAWYQASEGKRFESQAQFDAAAREALSLKLNGALPSLENLPVREGSPFSRIEIPRLGVSVIVLEGVQPRYLRLGAGHIPGTALPGESGNVAIAGHRDTFFRKLSQIRGQDRITLTTLRGSFAYSVESTQIVNPDAVEVLRPSDQPTLTLITCYPFSYIGAAPQRFVVKARQESYPELLGTGTYFPPR